VILQEMMNTMQSISLSLQGIQVSKVCLDVVWVLCSREIVSILRSWNIRIDENNPMNNNDKFTFEVSDVLETIKNTLSVLKIHMIEYRWKEPSWDHFLCVWLYTNKTNSVSIIFLFETTKNELLRTINVFEKEIETFLKKVRVSQRNIVHKSNHTIDNHFLEHLRLIHN
jgi:hypothetical protein